MFFFKENNAKYAINIIDKEFRANKYITLESIISIVNNITEIETPS